MVTQSGDMRRAVFLDRDGVICREEGYISDPRRLQLLPGSGDAIRLFNRNALTAVVITNQSGVARGFFPEAAIVDMNRAMKELLEEYGACLDGIYYCPHHPTAGNSRYTTTCDCRKPGTGLIDRAARELDIDIKQSYVVGDKWSDIELGQRSGAHSILVRTGFAADDAGNARPPHVKDPDFVAHTISEAADWIVEDVQRKP